jgi:hypothetical protein
LSSVKRFGDLVTSVERQSGCQAWRNAGSRLRSPRFMHANVVELQALRCTFAGS